MYGELFLIALWCTEVQLKQNQSYSSPFEAEKIFFRSLCLTKVYFGTHSIHGWTSRQLTPFHVCLEVVDHFRDLGRHHHRLPVTFHHLQ